MNFRDKDIESGIVYFQATEKSPYFPIESQNIVGNGFGKKITGGKIGQEIAYKFFVNEKKPISELDPDEIVPEFMTVGNKTYKTDVVEIKRISALGCQDWFPGQTTPTEEQNSHRVKVRPLVGGLSTINYDDIGNSAGTLGLLARDLTDNSIVGVTNAHVICAYTSSNSEKTNEIVYNTYNKITVQPAPIDTAFVQEHEIGIVKRYFPLKNGSSIDAALMHINGDVSVANGQFNLFDEHLPWATDEEIDSLLENDIPLSKSGRTTGSIGSAAGCPIIATDIDVSITVAGYDKSTKSFTFTKCIAISYADFSQGVAVGGDSGSAVVANFNGTRKIVGLLFAAGSSTELSDQQNNFAIVCRITEIANKLKISQINLETETAEYGKPENWRYKASSSPNTDEMASIEIDGRTYWSIGNAYLS